MKMILQSTRLLLFILIWNLLALPGNAQEATPNATPEAKAAGTTTPEPQPTQAEQIDLKLKSVSDALAEAEKLATPEAAQAQGLAIEDLQARVGRLREFHSLLQRQLSALRRRAEIEKSSDDLRRKAAEFKEKGVAEPPPYKIALLDSLLDQLEAEQSEDLTFALTIETLERALAEAEARLVSADQVRRESRDRLVQNADPAQKPKLEFAATEAETSRRIAEEGVRFASISLETSRLEQKFSTEQTDLLKARIAAIKPTVIFTKDEFEERKLEIAKRRDRFERELLDMQSTHEANESRRTDAREALEKARGEAEIASHAATLDMRDAWAMVSSRAVEIMESRLDDLRSEEDLWRLRYEANRGADDLALLESEKQSIAIREEIASTRKLTEARLADIRSMALDLEKKVSAWEETFGDKATAESKLKALRKREENASGYLDGLITLDRLARRLEDEIKTLRANPTWDDRWVLLKDKLTKFWNREVFTIDDRSFTLIALSISAATFAVVLMALFGLRWLAVRRLRKSAPQTSTQLDDLLLLTLEQTGGLFFLAVALWLAIKPLPISTASAVVIRGFLSLLLISQMAVWGNALLAAWVEQTMKRRRGEDPASVSALGAISFFGRVIMWLIVVLVAFYSFGIEIGPLVAGLGITGIAIAFALQNILGDVLCSIAILLDKPFVVGDFIIVGDARGTVEHIGIKTTRLRSQDGQLTIFPNAVLMGMKIDNFKRMYERRVLTVLSLVYGTPAEKLEIIPKKLRELIESRPLTRFERAHFVRYGSSALELEVVYFVLSADYNRYMDTHQAVLLDIYRWFGEQEIEFALTAPPKPTPLAPPGAKVSNPTDRIAL